LTTEVEVELKLAVPGAFSLPDLTLDEAVAEVRQDDPQDLCASYWDTVDLRLARHGVTLRRRSGEPGGPHWTLKLPLLEAGNGAGAGAILARREIELEGAADRIPAQAIDLVTAYVRTAPLAEIAELRTRRRRWLLLDATGRVTAVLVDDEVSVMDDGEPVSRFRELELESRTLAAADLLRIGERLRSGGAVDAEPIPKVIRALGPAATAPADAVAPATGPDLPASAAVKAALTAAVERMVAHDAGTRLGDPESLHQARVGLRTLRSHLRTFAPLIDQRWSNGIVQELGGLARTLGRVRDFDVLIGRLDADARDLHPMIDPLFADLGRRRDRARAVLLERLRDERYASLLERLVAAAAAPRLVTLAARRAGEVLPPLYDDAWSRLAKRADALSAEPTNEELHAVRIGAKRARYTAEAIAPALDPDRARAARNAARALAALQGLLGTLQDAAVARDEILSSAVRRTDEGPFNLAAGTLLERQARVAAAARDGFPNAWKAARRPRHRRWARP
jgi:CHAD domain-containing protein